MKRVALAVVVSWAVFSPSARAIDLIGSNLFPESITLNERTNTFYVTDSADGSVQKIENGKAEIFQKTGTDGRTGALGIKVDDKNDRLWVVSPETVYIYKLSTNELITKLDRKSARGSAATDKPEGLNDVVIDLDGNAYVTDSFNPKVYKVRHERNGFVMSLFRNVSENVPNYTVVNDFPYNLNGLVISPDGESVISVKTNDGTLWRMNIRAAGAHEIKLAEPVTKGDGLVWGEGEKLYIIRNFENKISIVDLGEGKDHEPRKVTTYTNPSLKVPTSAVYVAKPNPHLIVVNSQFDKKPPVAVFNVVEVPASPEAP